MSEINFTYKKKYFYSFFKRIFDIVCSLIAIIIFSIPMIIVALAIKIDSKGPVIFKQKRYGKNRKVFKIYKFRSMYINTDPNEPTNLLQNAESHITKVGKFIRKTSIDELPQLFNIFLGQMSFVGPRPVLCNETDLINERDKYFANNIKPGLTGLAQVKGRDQLDIYVKAKYDGLYVQKREFFYDIYLIIKTFIKVFTHEGIVEGAQEANVQRNIATPIIEVAVTDVSEKDEILQLNTIITARVCNEEESTKEIDLNEAVCDLASNKKVS